MDALDGLLDGPRSRGAFLLNAVLDPPWSIHVEDQAPMTVVVVLGGSAVFTGSQEPTMLAAGDLVLARGPEPYTLADSRATPEDIRILPGQVCVDPSGRLLDQPMALGVRTWGNRVDGATSLLIGTYEHSTAVGESVLSRLPSDVVLRGPGFPVVDVLAAEVARNLPGQSAVLDRLLDVVLMAALREIFSTSSEVAPPWYSAEGDAVVGRAIQLIQRHPANAWTVAGLADECAVSRATLARRFTRLAGEPPMSFLARWRLTLAADLLSDPRLTIGSVAAQVGYGDAFALSAAFKRRFGVAPTEYRRTAMTTRAEGKAVGA